MISGIDQACSSSNPGLPDGALNPANTHASSSRKNPDRTAICSISLHCDVVIGAYLRYRRSIDVP